MEMKKKGSHRESGQILHMRSVRWLTGPSISKPTRSRQLNSRPYKRQAATGFRSTAANRRQNNERGNSSASTGIKPKNNLNRPAMWPKFNQVFLAFSTLLFFASIECLLYMIFTINPGLIARSFSPTQCKIVQKGFNGNISCYTESFVDHGKKQIFPCLQVYVVPEINEESNDMETKTALPQQNENEDTRIQESSSTDRQVTPSSHQSDCDENCTTEKLQSLTTKQQGLLLYQNEYNYAGMDYLYRRCSYLPSVCVNNLEQMIADICQYAVNVGETNSTIDCFYNDHKKWVILEKKIAVSDVAHALLWPILGMLTSIWCCVVFWKRNHNHISRLYIYNSWAAS